MPLDKRRQSSAIALNFLENLLKQLEIPFFVKNEEGRWIISNDKACDLLGMSCEEVIGRQEEKIFSKEAAERLRKIDERVYRTGETVNHEVRLIRKDEERTLSISRSLQIDPDSGEPYIVGMIREVTAKRAVDSQLEFYRIILENMAEGVVLVRIRDATVVYANFKFLEMFGYSSGELVGKPVHMLNAEQEGKNPQEVSEQVIRLLQPTGSAVYEILNKKKDNTLFWCRANTTTFEHEEFGPIWITVHQDIDEEIKTREALHQNEEYYRRIVETANEGIWIIDAENRTSYVNKTMSDILGYQEHEMIGKYLFDFMGDEWRRSAERYLLRRRRGVKEHHDFHFLRKNGDHLWAIVSTNPIFDQEGKYHGALAMITDITDRKKLEIELYNSNTILRSVYLSLDEAVFIIDPRKRIILSCNSAAEEMFGYKEYEMVGWNTDFLYTSKKSYHQFGKLLFPVLDAEGIFHTEFIMKKKDGTVFNTDHTVKEIKNQKGERTMVVSVIRDITEMKITNKELKIKEETLKEKNIHLNDLNATLKILLDQREEEKQELEESFSKSIVGSILPYFEKIRDTELNPLQEEYIDILESNLKAIVEPLRYSLSGKLMHLSPSETKVANYVKRGYSTKKIATLLHVSPRTVEFHRNNIRQKLGLKDRKTNLQTYLKHAM